MKKQHLLFNKRVLRSAILGISSVLFYSSNLFAQALTGVKTIPGSYSSIALAVADLNANGVGAAGVTFNVSAGYTETLTQNLVVTATGTAANPIVFKKNGAGANPLITAYAGTANTTGSAPDGIWTLVGSDYVTIDGIDLLDPVSNASGSATMEYGFGLFKASGTNGCQSNTIKNCVVTLNRENNGIWTFGHNGSIGIVVFNSKYNDATNQVVVTSFAGTSSYNKFYTNTIQNVNAGIAFNGFPATFPYNLGDTLNDVGGSSLSTGNNILNFGGGTGAANPATGVFAKDQWGLNVSYNNINNNTGSGVNHINTLRGIFLNASSYGASAKINNNFLSIKGAMTGANAYVIENAFGGNVATNNSIEINNNTITGCSFPNITGGTVALINSSGGSPRNLYIKNNILKNDSITASGGTFALIMVASTPMGGVIEIDSNTMDSIRMLGGAGNTCNFYGITTSAGPNGTIMRVRRNTLANITQANLGTGGYSPFYLTSAIANGTSYVENNTITGLTAKTTGVTHLFYFPGATTNLYFTGNKIVGGFNRTGTSGTFYGFFHNGFSQGGASYVYDNDLSSMTLAGAAVGYAFTFNTSGTHVITMRKNIVNAFSGTTSTLVGASISQIGPGSIMDSNTFSNFNGTGAIFGVQTNTTYVTGLTIRNNTFNNFTGGGTASVMVQGINLVNGTGAVTSILNNTIYGLSTTNPNGGVYGINSATTNSGNTVNIVNNRISGLAAPAAHAVSGTPNQIVGINSPMSVGNQNIYHNTIVLSGTSSGGNFGSTALSVNIGATLDLRNNILINNCTPNGTGRTVAFRRSGASLTSLAATTNNNILYAGDSTIAFRHIYSDGANVDTLMSTYQARMGSRETNSRTENTTFLSTTGTSSNYLKIDPAIFTYAESKAGRISSISTDANGTIRASFAGYVGTGGAPDIGAVEGSYMGNPSDQMVYVSSDILQISGNVARGTTNSPVLRIQVTAQNTYNALNVSTFKMNTLGTTNAVDISSAKVYFTGNDTVFNTTDLFGSVANPSGIFFINGAKTLASGVNNFWLTYDVKNTATVGNILDAVGDNITVDGNLQTFITSAPAGSRTIKDPLSGTYTVGVGQNYTHISDAMAELYTLGVSGPVRFVLKDVLYNAASGEQFPIQLKDYAGRSAVNTVTIMPDMGVAAVISVTTATPVFLFDNARYFVIDGSQGGLGGYLTNSSLRIETRNTASPTVALRNESSNNIIKYTEVVGRNTTAVSNATFAAFGVISFQSTTGTNGNDNNIIRACAIHADGSSLPNVCIGSIGSLASDQANNDGNIIDSCYLYDYFHSSTNHAGIYISIANSAWSITNNRFFQTAPRTWTSPAFSHRAIWIQTASTAVTYPGGFIVKNNFIGGSDSAGNGTYTIGPVGLGSVFAGIEMAVAQGTPSSVQGNTITNIYFSSSSTSVIISCPINLNNGNINCGTEIGNIIGSNTVRGAITYNAGTTSGGIFSAIRANNGGVYNIQNNLINGINITSAGANNMGEFAGINVLGNSYTTVVSKNIIGDTTGNNMIEMTNVGAISTFASRMYGILVNPSATITPSVSVVNNTIAGFSQNCVAAVAAKVRGINLVPGSSGFYLVKGNAISNLKSAVRNTSSGTDVSLAGISIEGTQSGYTIDSNIIHSLTLVDTAATLAVKATGIAMNCLASGANVLSRNFIHSISKTSANPSEVITGIEIVGGNPVVVNNMIRLGIDSAANAITVPMSIRGIAHSAGNAGIFFNTVHIGGTGVGASSNRTFAFVRSGSGSDDVRNNIFANMRMNAVAGSGLGHFAVSVANNTGLTQNYNILFADSVGVFNNIPQYSINNWKSSSLVDANSLNNDPKLINPTGDETTVNLSIDPVLATPIEAYGQAVSALGSGVDFAGQDRASLTPVDIGADAGNFNTADFASPLITYTALQNVTGLGDRILTATISDLTGIYQTPLAAPRIYYKKAAGGTLLNATGVRTSGNANNGTWNFTISSASLGGLAPNDSIYYFVVAQDSSVGANLGSNPAGAEGVAVGSISSYPPFNAYKISELVNGIINVGVGQPFPNLTGPTGAFSYIGSSVLNGNVTIAITSDIEEPGTVALTPWAESGVGNYRIRIVPSTNAVMSLTSRYRVSPANTDAFMRLDGADRVTIDGSYSGSGRYLRFLNRDSLGATLNLLNDADRDTIANCIFEGINKTVGTINLFGTNVAGGTGNDSNVIIGCLFRDTLGSAVTHPFIQNKPNTGVFSQGVAGAGNDYNQVVQCEFDNIRYNAFNISATGGDYWRFYNNAIYMTNDSSFVNLVYINIAGGGGHTVRKNSIGGSAPDRSGPIMKWHYTSTVRPIYYSSASVLTSVFDSNTIGNVAMFNPGSAVFQPSFSGSNGYVIVKNNVIGGALNPWDTISIQNTAYALLISMAGEVANNTIGNIYKRGSTVQGMTAGVYVSNAAGQTVTLHDNVIRDLYHSYTNVAYGAQGPVGIYMFTSSGGTLTVERNTIYNIGGINGGCMGRGIHCASSGAGSFLVNANRIYNIFSTAVTSGSYASALSISGSAPVTFTNNQISLGEGTNKLVFGLLSTSNPGSSVFYNNSVFINGVGDTSSYGVYLQNIATVNMRNNIFFNKRTSTGLNKHLAVGTAAQAMSGVVSNLQNNLFVTADTSMIVEDMGLIGRGWYSTDTLYNTTYNKNWAAKVSEIPADSLFMDTAVANLDINTSRSHAWYANGKGMPTTAVTGDYNNQGTIRSTAVATGSIDIGADEFNTSTLPPIAFADRTPVYGDSTQFYFGSRMIAKLNWGVVGSLPASVDAYYYSGVNAPNLVAGRTKTNAYWNLVPLSGNGYTAMVTLLQDSAILGDVVDPTNLDIAQYGTFWKQVATTTVDNLKGTFNSGIFITGNLGVFTGTDGSSNPLPVKLLNIAAIAKHGDVLVNWSTASELNNRGFEVERSKDGYTFESIGFVKGAGNSNRMLNYAYTDIGTFATTSANVLYYRIKQVDANGAYTYSEVVRVSDDAKQMKVISAYPNPFNNELNVVFQSATATSANIRILNIQGKVAVELKQNVTEGLNRMSIEGLTQLSNGMYFVELTVNGEVTVMKMLKN